ncbi:MAG: hypothetical protein KJO37_04140, partial [Bacteroidia bacterium]|nr:hypothetical protein [Bacteroidia bacterium]
NVEGSIIILDQTGRFLHKEDYHLKGSSNIQIDVSDFKPGILFFIYEQHGERMIYKIIKK